MLSHSHLYTYPRALKKLYGQIPCDPCNYPGGQQNSSESNQFYAIKIILPFINCFRIIEQLQRPDTSRRRLPLNLGWWTKKQDQPLTPRTYNNCSIGVFLLHPGPFFPTQFKPRALSHSHQHTLTQFCLSFPSACVCANCIDILWTRVAPHP